MCLKITEKKRCGELIASLINNKVISANQEAVNIIGLSEGDIIGEAYTDILKFNKVTVLVKETKMVNNEPVIVFKLVDNNNFKNELECNIGSQNQLMHKSKLEAIGTLASGIAHEINSPIQFVDNNMIFIQKAMNQILGFINDFDSVLDSLNESSEIIEKKKKLIKKHKIDFYSEESPIAIEQSLEGINRITNIVQAMKNFSHMGNGQKSYEDINEAINTTVTISKNEWKYDSDLLLNLEENLPNVKCNIGDIKQVLLNLIINAVHAIKDKKKEENCNGEIVITSSSNNEKVIIKVKDTGLGIKEEIKEKVFKPFFTTKKVGVGTGQGLTISYNIITKKHFGKLYFESEEKVGTTFIIELPIHGERIG